MSWHKGTAISIGALLIIAATGGGQESSPSASVVPRLVSFSGVVNDSAGKPASGSATLTFSLYEVQDGGSPLWVETQTVQTDGEGHYTAFLGAASPGGIPLDLFSTGSAKWLGIAPSLPGMGELPRILLVGVPYALKAADADTLGGKPASAFVTVDSQSSSSNGAAANQPPQVVHGLAVLPLQAAPAFTCSPCAANYVPILTDTAGDLTDSVIYQTGGEIGIGTTTPASTLDVKGGAYVRGVLKLPSIGTATASKAYNSQPLDLLGSAYSSSSGATASQHFRLQAEPLNSPSPVPSGTLNLLFASGSGTPAETGLSIGANGAINFASGQTFPAATFTGSETVQGSVSASGQLISTAPTGTPPLAVSSTTQVPYLNASLLGGLGASSFALVGAPNVFSGNQSFLGNVGVGTTTPFGLFTVGSGNLAFSVANADVTVGSWLRDDGNLVLSTNTGDMFLGYIGNPNKTIHLGNGNPGVIQVAGSAPAGSLVIPQSGNVGIGTTAPAAKLEVNGTAQFDQPVTFASGQMFPGAGTITGVTAGTGLSGGGTSGNVTLSNTGVLTVAPGTGLTSTGGQAPTLSLNTGFTNGLYAQLGASNTFTGTQTVSGNVTITGSGNGVTFSDGSKQASAYLSAPYAVCDSNGQSVNCNCTNLLSWTIVNNGGSCTANTGNPNTSCTATSTSNPYTWGSCCVCH
jgi:hypothetical protein